MGQSNARREEETRQALEKALIKDLLDVAKLCPQRVLHLTDSCFVIGRQCVAGKSRSHNHLALTFIRNYDDLHVTI